MERGANSRGIIAACVAMVTIALTLVGSRAIADGNATTAGTPGGDALQDLLRLHDLPLGYRWESESFVELPFTLGCNSIEPAEAQPRLAAFLARYSPAGCMALYTRLFRVEGGQPAPLAVGTGALDAGSVKGAEAGLMVSRELLSHLLGDELPTEVSPPTTIGDATRLYHWEHGGLFAPDERSSSFLVWRSGNVVASIFVGGGPAVANDREAAQLARLQQARIEAPTPYTPAEVDDTEVALEDPALKMPLYWLGRTFTPGGGFPAMKLADTSSSTGPGGAHAGLFYAAHLIGPPGEGLFVDLWSAKRWKRLQAKGRPFPNSLRCPTVHKAGRIRPGAAILQGFEPYDRRCHDRRHRSWALRVRFGRVVVTAETANICATCARAGTGSYNSFKGMAEIARGLVRRPRP
jgi:hypothetical protein